MFILHLSPSKLAAKPHAALVLREAPSPSRSPSPASGLAPTKPSTKTQRSAPCVRFLAPSTERRDAHGQHRGCPVWWGRQELGWRGIAHLRAPGQGRLPSAPVCSAAFAGSPTQDPRGDSQNCRCLRGCPDGSAAC